MSSSNNSNRKDDGSIITVDEFKSKVNQGKCFAGLAFSALLKADQELKENGEISSSTRNMLFMIQFNCLATSRALGLAAGDVELNSTSSSSLSKVLSNLAYELDQYVQQIKIFLKAHNMGHIPQEFSALLTAMASPTKEPGSPPSSIAMSVKRKRASKGIAGPALKRADDGDFTKSIQVYDSDGQTDDDDGTTIAPSSKISGITDSIFGKSCLIMTNGDGSERSLAMNMSKPSNPYEEVECICGQIVQANLLKKHCSAPGLTKDGRGEKGINILKHCSCFMMMCRSKPEDQLTWEEQVCLDGLESSFTNLFDPSSSKHVESHLQVFLAKTESIFKRGVHEGALGPHLINFVRLYAPACWARYKFSLTPGGLAEQYVANLEDSPSLLAASHTRIVANSDIVPFLDTKPAAVASTPSNATDGPPSPLTRNGSIFKSLSLSDSVKPASLKSAITSPSSGTVADKSIEDLQPPREEELIPLKSAIPPANTGTRHASTAVAAPNTPIDQTHNAFSNTSGPTVDTPRANHAQRRNSATSASMSSNGIASNLFGAGVTTSPTTSNTSNEHSLLSAPNERGDPPTNPIGGETTENPFDMLERLLRQKKLATESQSDSLAAKIDKRIKILENELFPDL